MSHQPVAGPSPAGSSNMARKSGNPGENAPQGYRVSSHGAPIATRGALSRTEVQRIRTMKAAQTMPFPRKATPPPPANRGATSQKASFVDRPGRPPTTSQASSFTYIAPLLNRERPRTTKSTASTPWWIRDASETPGNKSMRSGPSTARRSTARMTTSNPVIGLGDAAPVLARDLLVKLPGDDVRMPKDAWYPTDPWTLSDSSHPSDGSGEDDANAVSSRDYTAGEGASPRDSPLGSQQARVRDSVARKAGGNPPRVQLATKAARKTKWLNSPSSDESSDDTSDDSDDERAKVALGKQRVPVLEITSSSPLESGSESESDADTLKALTSALDALTLPVIRLMEYKRLPFLVRNLRCGYLGRCRMAGLSTTPQASPKRIAVQYRCAIENQDSITLGEDSDGEYEQRLGHMSRWECPLCPLHGHFLNKSLLDFHLAQDHAEAKFSWQERRVSPEGDTFNMLHLDLPMPVEEDDFEEISSDDEEEITRARLSDSVENHKSLFKPAPSNTFAIDIVRPGQTRTESEVIDLTSPPPSPLLIPKKFRAASPVRPSITPVARRSITAQPRQQSYRGSLPARYPSPPPPSHRLGPAAQYPYLPEPTEDGNGKYSCRPGGPRIFDLLSELPLQPFGVLAWSIVEREDELFEMDDIRDEDKVMLALWNRWIMIKRIQFIYSGYAKGAIAFVDENWCMIHRAAGWGALRVFLLMLMANKFLEVGEVVRILKHYETHTGMDDWYKEDGIVNE